jgi:GntR family transcriptional regulator
MLRLAIDPRSPVPLHAQISEAVQLAIARGDLGPGEQLPTVRELSVQLKVNSNTVARVYSELERSGALETFRGKGTFVRERPRVALGVRERRLSSLCRTFARLCAEEGYSLGEVLRAMQAVAGMEVVR